MAPLILFVGMAPVPLSPETAADAIEPAALAARLDAGAGGDEPAVIVFGAGVHVPAALALARKARGSWHNCELVFVAAAGAHLALSAQLARAPMIGAHWSAVPSDSQLAGVIDTAIRNALRRARLRTTLASANVKLAAPRQIDDSQYQRLSSASHYLSNFMAQTPDGIVGLDTGLRVVHWNDSAQQQWQLTRRQALGVAGPELPFWSEALADAVAAALAGAPARSVDSRQAGGAGIMQVEFGVSGVRDDSERLIGVSLVIRDSTERQRRLEDEREEERARAAAITAQIEAQRRQLFHMFDLAPGFIAVTTGPRHIFAMANRAYTALFGRRADTHVSVASAFPELANQDFVAIRDRVFASGEPYIGKARRVVTRDDDGVLRERFIDFVYQPWRDDSGAVAGIFCQGQDVTEQKLMQDGLLTHQTELEELVSQRTAALQDANLALQQSQKLEAIGKLTGGVAHDFNNILQVIGSNLDLMSLAAGLPPSLRQRIASSTAAVERAARLSTQLLAFARRQPLQPVPTNVTAVVDDMRELLSRALGEAINVAVIAAPGLWNCLVDRHQLENVILNLAINARDAMAARGALTIELANVALDARYAASRAELHAGDYVLLAVSDTGTGMEPAVLRHVFEPFFTTKPEGEGTGLGLSMAYGFVKQSGGHIDIYSEPGEGTTVRIYLPRCLEAAYTMAQTAGGEAPGGSETVLVVEDDAAVRISVVDMLKELGYAVLSAHDAESALAMLHSGVQPDLLFTDVVMPGRLRSPDLAHQAQELVPGIAVLFTSGYTQNAIVHAGRLDKGVNLLSKPYRRSELAHKIRQLLDADEPEQAVPPDAPPQRVLVVEDNEDGRDMLRELLLMLGYAPECFGSAAGVLDALQANDILLTDVTLPGQSGIELAEQARKKFPGLRVVFATGRAFQEAPAGGAVLVKPFSLDQLRAVLA